MPHSKIPYIDVAIGLAPEVEEVAAGIGFIRPNRSSSVKIWVSALEVLSEYHSPFGTHPITVKRYP